MMAASANQLQFAPYCSALDGGFWHTLSRLKLEEYGLDDSPKHITGFYTNGDAPGLPSRLSVDYASFDPNRLIASRNFSAPGMIHNKNTFDEFRDCDKKALLDECGKQNLKKYHYHYWFIFPALCCPKTVELQTPPVAIETRFTPTQITSLVSSYDEIILPQRSGYFLLVETSESVIACPLSEFSALHQSKAKILLCVCDPCSLDSNPGWPLRNFLALASYHWSSELGPKVEVVCLRDRFKDGKRSISHSIVLDLNLINTGSMTEIPKCVGWEKNEGQKLGPRKVNLSKSMDPKKLAESAVDLNLKLMRWRLMPDLDLEKIKATKCLLLGSGTLGCNVARVLLGWGVRHLTLVDSGKVSYSNPVRQSLFIFEDSLNGGRPKAEAAADALRKIFPGVNATGLTLSIPMPGHPVTGGQEEATRVVVQQLETLVDEHDALFLLMDTRESRWLPSLLGASKHKIVMNAALGFDTFLVLRHGLKRDGVAMDTDAADGAAATPSLSADIPGYDLGCYFCNDVVAPGDSTRDRTLDQQCTVSRPGISMLAASIAVEMFVSLLVHPQGGYAKADMNAKDDQWLKEAESPLGFVPHQMRGFMSRFHHVMPACRAYDKCTACSETVVTAYRESGFDFLLRVFNEPRYLEDITGLTELHQTTELAEVWELSDDEEM